MTLFSTLIFLLFVCVVVVHSKPWQPLFPEDPSKQQFLSVILPDYYVMILPKLQDKAVIKVPVDAPYIDACRMPDAPDCVAYFCSDDFLSDFKNIGRHALMHNRCNYCVNNNTAVVKLEEFLNMTRAGQCKHFLSFPNPEYCRVSHLGHPFLIRELVNYSSSVNPFGCYCPAIDKYGHVCDVNTAFFNDFSQEYAQYSVLAVYFLVTVAVVLTVTLPDTYFKCTKCIPMLQKKNIKQAISHFADAKTQAVFLVTLALIFNMIEQINATLWVRYSFRTLRQNLPGGIFRSLSSACLILSYSTILILWSNVCSKVVKMIKGPGLDWCHTFMLLGFYAAIGIVAIAVITVALVTRSTTVIYSVIGISLLIYVCIFPIGFTAHAIRLYCALNGAKTVNFKELKFTKFVVLCNILFLLFYAFVLPVVIGYVAGWDYASYFLGQHRNLLLDSSGLLLVATIVFLLFKWEITRKFYRKILRIKGDTDDDDML